MEGLVITKLRRDPRGHLVARVSREGRTLDVTRRYGSWTTVPDDHGSCREILPLVAKVLQERARRFERAEHTTNPTGQGGAVASPEEPTEEGVPHDA